MGRIIIVCSGKGGVGKTTAVAMLGKALSLKSKKILMIDTDFGLRNLDIVLNVQSEVVYDILDCIDNRCELSDAVIKIPVGDELYFLPAPQSRSAKYVDKDKLKEFILGLKNDYDYIFLDSPAGIGDMFELDASISDGALVIAKPHLSSVRDADRCVEMLMNNNVSDFHLIINAADIEMIRNEKMMKPEDMLDLLGIPVIGIIPYDLSVSIGEVSEKSPAFVAYKNTAARILGNRVPVTYGKILKRSFIEKIKTLFSK